MPSTTSRPPLTRFTTPGGSPSASSSSNAICCVSGTCSEGLRMKVFPQAMANGRNQNGTIAGKLNGTIAAHTPTGWRIVSASMFLETSSSTRPCIVVGIAQAHSTISIMRATSARASTSVLPISVVSGRARSSWRGGAPARRAKGLLANRGGAGARGALGAGDEPLPQLEQLAGARDGGDLPPRGQRLAGGAHGGVEVRGARERHAREHLAGGGVGDVQRV